MTLRCGWLTIALLLGCTGANPAFDSGRDLDSGGADDEDGSSTSSPITGDATTESSTPGSSDDGSETTDATSDTGSIGTTCSTTPPFAIGIAAEGQNLCPRNGIIRGEILELTADKFTIADCGDCSLCEAVPATWTFTIPDGLMPESLGVADCIDVHFDCDEQELPALRNLAVKRGSSAPVLVIAAPALPQTLGAWGPTIVDGAACPTDTCPDNAVMSLQFLQEGFTAGAGGRGHILVGDSEIELDVFVGNAHYDPTTCEPVVRWAGKTG